MFHLSLKHVLFRFWMGLSFSAAAGFIFYRMEIFDPLSPAFKVLTLGSTLAGLLALWRSQARGHATLLALGYALFCLGFFDAYGWVSALSGIAVGAGLVSITVIFDALAPRLRFGKFLLAGPLLGGLLFAAAPMIEFRTLLPLASIDAMISYGQLGWILGCGTTLGVELSDLLLGSSDTVEQSAAIG